VNWTPRSPGWRPCSNRDPTGGIGTGPADARRAGLLDDDEAQRLAVLRAYGVLDTPADVVLQRVAASMPHGQTYSIGRAELAAGQDIPQAMIEADAALYVAKESGRNQIRHF
jgi:GGDEF domain-containing protein